MDKVLPVVKAWIAGKVVRALVDTGCSVTLVKSCHGLVCSGVPEVAAFDGRLVSCKGRVDVEMRVGDRDIKLQAIVVEKMIDGIEVVLGMDAITKLGGVMVSQNSVKFGQGISIGAVGWSKDGWMRGAECLRVEDKDFSATFDGEKWTVKWVWKHGEAPVLENRVGCYDKGLVGERKEKFENVVDKWIEEGVLRPFEDDSVSGNLPLMAVEHAFCNVCVIVPFCSLSLFRFRGKVSSLTLHLILCW